MTRRVIIGLAVTLALGVAVGALGTRMLSAQPAPQKSRDLLRNDLAGIEGKEAILQLVEFAPRGASGKHYHNGQEVVYVLDGALTLEREGMPPLTLKTGESVFVGMPRHVHEGKNASATSPVKVIVFRVHEKGQPVTVRVTEPYFQQ